MNTEVTRSSKPSEFEFNVFDRLQEAQANALIARIISIIAVIGTAIAIAMSLEALNIAKDTTYREEIFQQTQQKLQMSPK